MSGRKSQTPQRPIFCVQSERQRIPQGGVLLRPVSVRAREPSAAQEAEILDVVNQTRRKYAKERRR